MHETTINIARGNSNHETINAGISCLTAAEQRNEFRDDLRNAIRKRLLDVHYQPQVDLRDGSCGHFEALLRWNDSERGFVSPATFVPIAEEMGLIDEITAFVIERVVSDLKSWQTAQLPVKSVAINISAGHFATEDRAEQLLKWLSGDSFPTNSITLELTETAMLRHTDIARKCLQTLYERGFAIALDDFGTGYSSIAYLLEFPISTIKIDRSFVTTIKTSFKCQAIIRALVDLAKVIGVDIVAEGVEHLEELRILEAMGCQFAQGYIFSKPLNEAQTVKYLRRQSYSEKQENAA
ncbi:MAG: EAL domain-containing protein [Candidatus Obscuribacterales bacterium]|nr:EAL domain-containing protein [Candidatus Obscuribacterales bacterium]